MTVFVIADSIDTADRHRRAHLRDRLPSEVVLLSTRTPLGVARIRGRRITNTDELRWLPGWSHGPHVADLIENMARAGWTGTPPT